MEVCSSTVVRSLLEFVGLDGTFVSSPVVVVASVLFFVSSLVSPAGPFGSMQLLV